MKAVLGKFYKTENKAKQEVRRQKLLTGWDYIVLQFKNGFLVISERQWKYCQ